MGCSCRADNARSRSKEVSASWLCYIIWAWFVVCFPYLGCASLSEPLTMFTAANGQIPGCPAMCGNLTIAYPFGIGRACALSDDYAIKCITENGTTFAQYVNNYTVILDFTETQLTTTFTPLARSCNSKGEETEGANNWGELHVAGKPYAISSTDNAFIVVGCHHYGLIRAKTRTGRKVTSCVALCTEQQDLYDGTCSGVGCCEASLPKGLQDLTSILEKIIYNTNVSSGKCGYSLLSKRSDQNLRRAIDLEDPDFYSKVRRLPGVLDWFIANATCSEARKNATTYVCQRHTTCIDLDQELDVYGYRCKCVPGFEGNPYLTPGCTDIDECKGSSNPCSLGCTNTLGSYRCYCPSGYQGDGTKNGTGCIPKTLNLAVPLGVGIGLGSVLFIIGGYWLFVIAKRRREVVERAINFKRNGGLLKQKMSSNEGMIEHTRLYTAVELDKATDHFNDDRILGQGGQGTVYKGMLSDGNLVAIKKSKKVGASHVGEFINEVVILSQINHRNIVKLLGCCLETEIPLLVYEFVPNGTLSTFIYDLNEDFPITWEMRLQIAVDVAGALNYLHSSSSNPIFHRDVKASNILLDAKYRAKLSDFGSSRSIAIDQTHLTTRVQGTFGYLDPEYFRSHQFTDKSDVYGFGVVLVELLTGLRPILPSETHEGKSLVSWFLSAMENSNLDDILATRVAKEGNKDDINATANLAKWCLNMGGKHRPSMRQVLVELEMISKHHNVHRVDGQKTTTYQVEEQTSKDITFSPSDRILPPYVDEDYSFPSNWSTNSQIQSDSIERFT